MKILTEASGSLVSAHLIKAIREAGHVAVASDIVGEVAARYLADDFVVMPGACDPELWDKMLALLLAHNVDMVIPSLDETLAGWSLRCEALRQQHGIHVLISPPETIQTFEDKWTTYEFFQRHDIPTPATSLDQRYPLVKPRKGRGSQGVSLPAGPVPMAGMISQELLEGQEYTVDVFCDSAGQPVYIVPRRRLKVQSGKSVACQVDCHPAMIAQVAKLCRAAAFRGPVNVQCFVDARDEVRFTEVNPRIAGGMALGFAATENWIQLAVDHFVLGKSLVSKPVRNGMRMFRYYAEVFVSCD